MRARTRDIRGLTGLACALVAVFAAGCGSAGKTASTSASTASSTPQAATAAFKAAGVLSPVQAAPPLSLGNYLGRRVNIASYRGRAVLVTFIYTHCPDVCPLITSNLRVAQNLMGAAAAKKLVVIAVSVDPRGDTPKTVARFLAAHEMTGRMQYLIGSAHELEAVWKAWGVGSERDAEQPELVEHSGLVYGITGSGKRLTIYAANFKPADIVHDVPLLAAR